jgi:hypothetical protein
MKTVNGQEINQTYRVKMASLKISRTEENVNLMASLCFIYK